MKLINFKNLHQFKYRLRLFFTTFPILIIAFTLFAKYGSSIGYNELVRSENISNDVVWNIYTELSNNNVVNLGSESEFLNKLNKKENRKIVWQASKSLNIDFWYNNIPGHAKYIEDYEEFEKALFSNFVWVKKFDLTLFLTLIIITVLILFLLEGLILMHNQLLYGKLSGTIIGLYLKRFFLKSKIRKRDLKKEVENLEVKIKDNDPFSS